LLPDQPLGDQGQMNLDAALQRVEDNADAEWKQAALEATRLCAVEMPEFTTDQVWRVLARTEYGTHEPRAMGAIMRQAVALGWVKPSNEYRTSERPECHKRPVKIWTSTIWKDHA
jgi:hypothetical protein